MPGVEGEHVWTENERLRCKVNLIKGEEIVKNTFFMKFINLLLPVADSNGDNFKTQIYGLSLLFPLITVSHC